MPASPGTHFSKILQTFNQIVIDMATTKMFSDPANVEYCQKMCILSGGASAPQTPPHFLGGAATLPPDTPTRE